MKVNINIDLDLHDPEYRIKSLISRIEITSSLCKDLPLRDDNPYLDAALQVLQGEEASSISTNIKNMFRIWTHSQQRLRMHVLLFGGCTPSEIAKALGINTSKFVENYSYIFFDPNVFTHHLEREAYADNCRSHYLKGKSAIKRCHKEKRDLLLFNKSMYEAYQMKQDALLAKYTYEINFPRASARIATDQYIAYASHPDSTIDEVKMKKVAASEFLKTARLLPELKEAYGERNHDFSLILEARILDRRTQREKQNNNTGLDRDLDPSDLA